ncbi:hypothetical protein [Zhongshania sp.]|uniref:NAD(P)H-dependent amine dehydrogenase family protein n=1 Tax=Zhongshania sp. TaxID=1971902 RepID=UPI0035666BFF
MSTSANPIRVVQWTTGKVASEAIKAILNRPNLELVGVFAFSKEKAGLDVGDLAGLGKKINLKATDKFDDIIALKPDCVVHMPLYPDVDQMCELLRAGINVVTSASFMTGYGYGDAKRKKLEDAAQAGGASLFGSGVNPGWINNVASAASGLCKEVNLIRITESFNIGLWAADANQNELGWGRPAGDPNHADDIRSATLPFGDAVEVVAKMYGIELDTIRCEVDFAHATEDLDVPGRDVKKGTVAGIHAKWLGVYQGHPVIDCSVQWTVAEEITPPWDIAMAYQVEILGTPQVKMKIDILPDDMTLPMEELMKIGFMFPAMPVVNAIPAVVAARPGIVTYADLKPVTSVFAPKAMPKQEMALVEADEPIPSSGGNGAADLAGKWQIAVKGPTGPQLTELRLERTADGYTGVQSGDGMDSPVEAFSVDGANVSWINRVSKPMKLKVTFTGVVDGDSITGKCKAGFMGKFAFTASRIN